MQLVAWEPSTARGQEVGSRGHPVGSRYCLHFVHHVYTASCFTSPHTPYMPFGRSSVAPTSHNITACPRLLSMSGLVQIQLAIQFRDIFLCSTLRNQVGFMKKLSADYFQVMPSATWSRMCCLLLGCFSICTLKYTVI
jgi:hypothetical protein